MFENYSQYVAAQTDGDTDQLKASLYDNLPVAIYTCDNSGYITSFNKAAVSLWGREPEIGKDLWCGSWKIFNSSGEQISLDSCPMARTLKEGVAIEGEAIIIERPDGSRVNVRPYPTPTFDSNGNLSGAVNTLINIDIVTEAEEKQALLASIVNTSDDAIISKTLDGNITSWNLSAQKMFGYTPEEALGKHISILIPPDRLQEETVIITNIRNGRKVDHFETIRLRKDGSEIPISLTVSPVLDSTGKVIGASKIARDITSQIQAQQENARLYEEIKALNEKKDEFIGIASHELKTPLTSINGYLQILSRLNTDEVSKKFVSKTIQQVKRLTILVSDMLDVSKIEAGKLQFSSEKFNIVSALANAIELIEHTHPGNNISFNVNSNRSTVYGDPHRVEQVMINLLTNAIKYSPAQAQIEVTLTTNNDEIHVSVKDKGYGIEASKVNQIFSRFYRVESTNPTISGLGIGLYISKQIIERHNGKIWVESEPGKGSNFIFSLPLKN
ncbi:MAG: PAS domain S-box protein [Sphingobacteriaceae bacterium]